MAFERYRWNEYFMQEAKYGLENDEDTRVSRWTLSHDPETCMGTGEK